MTTAEIKKYLHSALEIELNIYTQKEIISRMENTCRDLGYKGNIQKPQKSNGGTDTFFIMGFVGVIVGIITAIVTAIIEYNSADGVFEGIIYAIIGFVAYGVLGIIIGGLTLGTLVAVLVSISNKKKCSKEYDQAFDKYLTDIAVDDTRVKRELIQKKHLKNEITRITNQLNDSKKNLQTLYSYNIVNPDYRNIYAISSFYSYFEKGRTASLGFNPNNGDQGAYNIYENERRMDLIITNTDEILNKLDMVMENQRTLANGLQRAQKKVGVLCDQLGDFIYTAGNNIEQIKECQKITAYYSEKSAQELSYLSWMHLLK